MTENFEATYTYTARNVHNPNKVVTFTLINEHMRVNLAGLFDQVKEIGDAEEKSNIIKQQLSTQAKPAAVQLIENVSGPVHVSDINFHLAGDELSLTIWQRVASL